VYLALPPAHAPFPLSRILPHTLSSFWSCIESLVAKLLCQLTQVLRCGSHLVISARMHASWQSVNAPRVPDGVLTCGRDVWTGGSYCSMERVVLRKASGTRNDNRRCTCSEDLTCSACGQQLTSWQEANQLGDIDASQYSSMGCNVTDSVGYPG
jgi:hypothetical protein